MREEMTENGARHMTIQILVSSSVYDYMPQGEFEVEVSSPVTVEELFHKVGEKVSKVRGKSFLDSVFVTNDGKLIKKEDIVNPGSKIKIFMPVFGG